MIMLSRVEVIEVWGGGGARQVIHSDCGWDNFDLCMYEYMLIEPLKGLSGLRYRVRSTELGCAEVSPLVVLSDAV